MFKVGTLLALGSLAVLIPGRSWDFLRNLDADQLPKPIAAMVILEFALVFVPVFMVWQWYALAEEGYDLRSSPSDRRYYDLSVFLLALLLLVLWYAIPYRFMANATHIDMLPTFHNTTETRRFVSEARSWSEDSSNWPWLAIPIIILGLPWARFVERTNPFAGTRIDEYHAAAGYRWNISRLVDGVARGIQSTIEQTIAALGSVANVLNEATQVFVKSGVDLGRALSGVVWKLLGLVPFFALAVAFLVPGVTNRNFVQIAVGLSILIGIAAAALVALGSQRHSTSEP